MMSVLCNCIPLLDHVRLSSLEDLTYSKQVLIYTYEVHSTLWVNAARTLKCAPVPGEQDCPCTELRYSYSSKVLCISAHASPYGGTEYLYGVTSVTSGAETAQMFQSSKTRLYFPERRQKASTVTEGTVIETPQ